MKVTRVFLTLILLSLTTAKADIHPTYLRAVQDFEQQNYNNALWSFNELLQEFPDGKESYFNRGLCLYKAGKYSEAILDLEESLQRDSLLADALFLKAMSYENTAQPGKAMNVLNLLCISDNSYPSVQQRIQNHRLAVVVSSKWYYMVIMAIIAIALVALLVSLLSSNKRG